MNWRSPFKQRQRWEQQMDAEFRFHLESQFEKYLQQGLTREDAERRARREFGALDLAKEECRDVRPAEWLERFLREIRHAVRSLRRIRALRPLQY